MIETLNAQQRRSLALAILVLAFLALVSVTVVPVWSINRHYDNAIESSQRRLEQLRRAAAVGAGLQARFDQLKGSGLASAHTLQSATPALAGAELQRILNRTVASHKAQVLSTQILPVAEERDFPRIAIKVRMRGTLQSIVDVFYAAETGEPFLFLNNIAIRSLLGRTSGRMESNATLETDFELTGYMPRRS